MSLPKTLLAAALAASIALPLFAAEAIEIRDPYARAASPTAMAGAAFMTLVNTGPEDDRLVAASTDAAQRVELHTHLEDAEGVMRMVEVEDGFAIPAGGETVLQRGGLHVMMMGLTRPFAQGEAIELTLTFEKAGDVTLTVPIDNERADGMGMAHGHGQGHGTAGN
jgi:copper(I)-binding protein